MKKTFEQSEWIHESKIVTDLTRRSDFVNKAILIQEIDVPIKLNNKYKTAWEKSIHSSRPTFDLISNELSERSR